MWPFGRAKAPPAAGELPSVQVPPARPKRPLVSSDASLAASRRVGPAAPVFGAPSFPPGVGPNATRTTGAKMALDENVGAYNVWANAALSGFWTEGVTFLGYPYLSELAQRPEYRVICETLADEMIRKWIKFVSKDDDEDKSDRIKELQEEFERLNVRELFGRLAQQDAYFGRAHLYVDTGDTDDPQEMVKSIGSGWDDVSRAKMKGKKIVALRTVEAVWCYPTDYNSNNPLKANWYQPNVWYAQATQVHRTRLLTFVGREVPDLLKPTYSFGGLSLSQMAKPYVDNWLATRQSVNDAISAYSVMVLMTNLAESMQDDGQQLFQRADFFNKVRDNRGLMIVDKDTEDLKNVAVPLGSLDLLQAQAQEHMAAVSHIPTVKLLGIQPAGLNADSEGVIRAFYDYVHSYQEHFFRGRLHELMGLIMISLWGDVDESIDFEFEPLWAMDEEQIATLEKSRADMDVAYVDRGVLSPEEARQRLANDEYSGYGFIDVDDVPDLEAEELGGLEPQSGRPNPAAVESEETEEDLPVEKEKAA